MRNAVRAGVGVGMLCVCAAWPATAQTIVGRVIEDSTGTPIRAAAMTLLSLDSVVVASTLSDSVGRFVVTAPVRGRYVLRSEALGYRDSTNPFDLTDVDTLDVLVRLSTRPVEQPALVVRSRPTPFATGLAGFYQRARENILGTFITRDEIEKRRPYRATEMLRTLPGVRLVAGRGGTGSHVLVRGSCEPTVFLDGTFLPLYGHTIDDFVAVADLEGIELYPVPGELPGRFAGHAGCAALLIWTHRG